MSGGPRGIVSYRATRAPCLNGYRSEGPQRYCPKNELEERGNELPRTVFAQ
jgi:hypothetical protein